MLIRYQDDIDPNMLRLEEVDEDDDDDKDFMNTNINEIIYRVKIDDTVPGHVEHLFGAPGGRAVVPDPVAELHAARSTSSMMGNEAHVSDFQDTLTRAAAKDADFVTDDEVAEDDDNCAYREDATELSGSGAEYDR